MKKFWNVLSAGTWLNLAIVVIIARVMGYKSESNFGVAIIMTVLTIAVFSAALYYTVRVVKQWDDK